MPIPDELAKTITGGEPSSLPQPGAVAAAQRIGIIGMGDVIPMHCRHIIIM